MLEFLIDERDGKTPAFITDMIKKYLITSTSLVLFSMANVTALEFTGLRVSAVSKIYIQSQGLLIESEFLMARAVRDGDGDGEHLLILNRKKGRPGTNNLHRIDYVELRADYYTRKNAVWFREWRIHDVVDCPELDAHAHFFIEHVSVTDLNFNQRAEIAVPYELFCGGGIDSSTIKVVMREGTVKLAIRGKSLVKIPGEEVFGGEHKHDKNLLLPANSKLKKHLDAVWKSVVIEPTK